MFDNSRDFYIKNLFASDGKGGKDVVALSLLEKLANAACLGAGHRSAERYDAPKCHPETREAVINDVMSWVDSAESKEPIMWMSGPAGAGKSAIAQTVCEICDEDKTLLASFFFSRTATGAGRDDGNRLVPTIACQLAIAVPEAKCFIIEALEDTAVLSYSMEVQLTKLVLQPLSKVYAQIEQPKPRNTTDIASASQSNDANIEKRDRIPHLVVIDGLDECNGPQIQSSIIRMTSSIRSQKCVRLQFLIVSRPELEIRNTFEIPNISKICAWIVLNEDYNPWDDIRVYLKSEFATLKREHTLKSSLMEDFNWPTPENIDDLVYKSTGQFIYASTIMKYLKNPRRDPRDILQSVIKTWTNEDDHKTSIKESPFAELDSLYKQVLNAAVSNLQATTDSITVIFQVLLFQQAALLKHYYLQSVSTMAVFLSMKKTKLELLLSDLHSIMFIHDDILQFYHASFGDFLKDPSRSGDFYIDEKTAHTVLAHHCFTSLCKYRPHSTLTDAEEYSRNFYFSHIKGSGYNDTLLKELNDSDTQKLRTMLSLIMQHETRDALDSTMSFNREMCVFFRITYSYFAIPLRENLKSICDRMTEILDEIVLSSYPSVEDAKKSILQAIFAIRCSRNIDVVIVTNLHECWLTMMLEDPERGKHLYLDSNKSLSLYTDICIDEGGVTRPLYFNKVAKYLLGRIEPSADIDTYAFQEMSKKIFIGKGEFYEEENEYGADSRDAERNKGRSGNIRDRSDLEFMKSVNNFIQECVSLKNARLEMAALEHPAIQEHFSDLDLQSIVNNDDPINLEQEAPDEQDQGAVQDIPLKQNRSNTILVAIKELPRNVLKFVCLC